MGAGGFRYWVVEGTDSGGSCTAEVQSAFYGALLRKLSDQ